MPAAPIPPDEAARLSVMHEYEVLDTACEESFDSIARLAARLVGTPIALVSLVDSTRQWFKARIGLDVEQTSRDLAFCAHAILTPDRPLVVADATEDARFADNALVTGPPHIRFYTGVPLRSLERQPLGTLCVIDTVPRSIGEEQVATLAALARTVETTLELRRALRRARMAAMTDPLTGLPNRPAFLDSLRVALARHHARDEAFALLYLDLDGFKRVNDTAGHAEGDVVLRTVGTVLGGGIGAGNLAARIGGDEFAAVLHGTDAIAAGRRAETLRATLNEALAAGGWPVTVSIGALRFLAPPAGEAEALALVDALMYRAKAAGKNRVVAENHMGSVFVGP